MTDVKYLLKILYRVNNSIIAQVSLKRSTLRVHTRNLCPFKGIPIWANDLITY